MANLGGWELVAILAVVVLLFGASKLPQMARSLGQSARVFKAEARGMKADEEAAAREQDKPADQQQQQQQQQLNPGQSSSPTTSSSAEDVQRNDTKN